MKLRPPNRPVKDKKRIQTNITVAVWGSADGRTAYNKILRWARENSEDTMHGLDIRCISKERIDHAPSV